MGDSREHRELLPVGDVSVTLGLSSDGLLAHLPQQRLSHQSFLRSLRRLHALRVANQQSSTMGSSLLPVVEETLGPLVGDLVLQLGSVKLHREVAKLTLNVFFVAHRAHLVLKGLLLSQLGISGQI